MVSLGCPKNQVDSEIMLGSFRKGNYEIVNDAEEAECIVVNTCGFIDSAKKESVDAILEMAEYKKKNCKVLLVAGCLAERYKDDITKEIPEVDGVIGTGSVDKAIEILEAIQSGEKRSSFNLLGDVSYLDGERILSTGKGYAYLKIAEGCDNCCTYCIIPKLRGGFVSRTIESILDEAKNLADNGVKEIILVAQDLTRYGLDRYNQRKLPELMRLLSQIADIEWIRLLYCYPEEITDELIVEMSSNPKICNYIDMPIQHISDAVLKKMGRRGTSTLIDGVINKLREKIPDITIRTSLITGFPQETEEDFSQLLTFVKKYKLDNLGVFAYSKEDGTAAAKMKGQIQKRIKLERQKMIMDIQKDIVIKNNKAKIGKTYKTLVENVSDDGIFYFGRTYSQAPEIDGYVYFTTTDPLEAGSFVNVKILNTDEYDLIGEVINEPTQ